MVNADKIAKTLKIDTEKVFEALPAMSIIIEKADIIEYAVKAKEKGGLTEADGFKIIMRIFSKLKECEKEFNDVFAIIFDVNPLDLTQAEKVTLIKNLLENIDTTVFF